MIYSSEEFIKSISYFKNVGNSVYINAEVVTV